MPDLVTDLAPDLAAGLAAGLAADLASDLEALLTLQTWFSPSLPTGAFAHSHGLEAAIDVGDVNGATEAVAWIGRAVRSGGLGNDAILCAEAWRLAGRAEHDGSDRPLDELDDLARALVAGRERLVETLDQGKAFADAVAPAGRADAPAVTMRPRTLPVAIGVAAARCGLPLEPVLAAMLQSAASNLVWIAARLVPYGQRDALGAIETLRAPVLGAVRRAATSGLEALGGDALGGDLASLAHESQRSRVCRT